MRVGFGPSRIEPWTPSSKPSARHGTGYGPRSLRWTLSSKKSTSWTSSDLFRAEAVVAWPRGIAQIIPVVRMADDDWELMPRIEPRTVDHVKTVTCPACGKDAEIPSEEPWIIAGDRQARRCSSRSSAHIASKRSTSYDERQLLWGGAPAFSTPGRRDRRARGQSCLNERVRRDR
jgi:hypothetical protein